MKNVDIGKIRKKMEKTLDPKRYEHTLGVAYTASCLAMCHGADPVKAKVAGLLHDSAKCMTNEKGLQSVREIICLSVRWNGKILFFFMPRSEATLQNQNIILQIRTS